jgi:DHA2 family lincomycin resistance protein-like MFS transporter
MLAASFVVVLNETILSVALPHLMRDFSIDSSSAQWVSSAFLLTMAIVVPTTGFLIERFNTRTLYLWAMCLFTFGTAIAAAAPVFPVLIAARVVQASGTAVMLPLLITTALTIVPFDRRGSVIGRISIVIAVAPAIGPTVSGLVLNALGWRWMFVVVLPFAIGAIILGALRVPNLGTPEKTRLDSVSVVLCALGFGGLIFGLSNFGATAQGDVIAWTAMGCGLIAVIAFCARQVVLQRVNRALLDLRTFESRSFSMSIVTVTISFVVLFGTLIILPIYTQTVLHVSATETGLLLLPGGLISGLLAPVVGRLYDHHGPSTLLVTGAIIVTASLAAMTTLGMDTPVWQVLAEHSALSFGLVFLFTPLLTSGLAALRPGLYPHGSAIMGTVQQVAAAAGVALYISILSSTSRRLQSGGHTATASVSSGVHTALVIGACFSVLAIPAAALIKAPPAEIGVEAPVRLH